ncbi:TonB-dependent receptor plug domain-containing protein [Pseudomonadota bacterium]
MRFYSKSICSIKAFVFSVCSSLSLSGAVWAQDMFAPPMNEEAFWDEIPMVMSATRMSQPVVDSPVAVSVITREMIEASGAREVPELFRLVPGFIVGYHDGHTPSVSYHMSLDRYARRMQVLIDGRSVYTTAIGGVPWATLHITMDDIERIEVVRGPNSASYGANSFLGVINIITHHAIVDKGTSVKFNLGDEGVKETYVRYGDTQGKLDYRLTAAYVSDDGFQKRKDYKWTQKFAVRGDYQLSSSDLIIFEGGTGMGVRGVENPQSEALSPPREKELLNHHQHLKWERTLGVAESLSVQFYHIFQRNFEYYTLRDYAPFSNAPQAVLDPLLADLGRRTERYDLEFQHNVSLGDDWRMAWGAGARQDTVWGGANVLGNSEIGNHLSQGFVNAEWEVNERWLANLGVMVEDYSTTGTDYSPRVGVNYKFLPSHSLRMTASKAIRTPSMFEYAVENALDGTLSAIVNGVNMGSLGPIYNLFWQGNQQVGVERITSYELGYNGTVREGGFSYDLKLYRDEIRDLITLTEITVPGNLTKVKTYVNSDAMVIRGLELEGTYLLPGNASVRLTYAYTTLEDLNNNPSIDYTKVAPKHSVGLLLIKPLPNNYLFSTGYYYTDEMNGWESKALRAPVRRLDLRIGKTTRIFGNDAEVALAGRNLLGKYEEMEVLRPKNNFSFLNEVGASVYISLRMSMN